MKFVHSQEELKSKVISTPEMQISSDQVCRNEEHEFSYPDSILVSIIISYKYGCIFLLKIFVIKNFSVFWVVI